LIKGLGIDTVEVERISAVYRKYGRRFLERIFHPREIEIISRWKELGPHLAGRFAAKEACLKALGTGASGGLGWKDILVLEDEAGRPVITLQAGADALASARGITSVHCSITHTAQSASAVVIVE